MHFLKVSSQILGFDKFELETATLSNKDGLINGFSFGPNPTRNHVNFKANVVLDEVSIYNILGKELLRRKLKSKQYSVDLTNYPVGIYIMKVESEGIVQTSKIIKR